MQPTMPVGPPPQDDRRIGQPRESKDDDAIVHQQMKWLEHERDPAAANHQNNCDIPQHDHHRDPANTDPAEEAMQIYPTSCDKDVLQQVNRHPPHERDGVRMDQRRHVKARPPHRQAERESARRNDSHSNCRTQEKSLFQSNLRSWTINDGGHFRSPPGTRKVLPRVLWSQSTILMAAHHQSRTFVI